MRDPLLLELLERTAAVPAGVAGVAARGSIARTAGANVGAWEM
jgi:hypothetical protein